MVRSPTKSRQPCNIRYFLPTGAVALFVNQPLLLEMQSAAALL